MSISIGNGRIVHASLSRTYDLLMQARPASVAMGRRLQDAWMARHAAKLIDQADIKGEPRPAHPIAEAWNSLADAERAMRIDRRRNPDSDFGFELWILPASRDRTLIMVQTEQGAFTDWFDALPFVRPHGYWDNVDRPDGVTAANWNRRRRDWETVLPRGVPSDRCLTLVMFNHEYPSMPTAAEALEHIPGRSERAVPIASSRHIDEAYRRLLAARTDHDPDYRPDGFGLVIEASDAARADAARCAEIEAETVARLREIGIEDLTPAF